MNNLGLDIFAHLLEFIFNNLCLSKAKSVFILDVVHEFIIFVFKYCY